VGVVRSAVFQHRIISPGRHVVEPELDMDRLGRRLPHAATLLRVLVRKLVPAGKWVVHSPMRSIAREIEEDWPSGEL